MHNGGGVSTSFLPSVRCIRYWFAHPSKNMAVLRPNYRHLLIRHARCILILVICIYNLRTRTVCAKEVDRGRPSGHSRRGLGSIRAICRAWRALKVFFCRREWVRQLPGFSFIGVIWYQVLPSIFRDVVFFSWYASSIRTRVSLIFENGAACNNSGSGFPVRFGVRYHPSLGTLRAVYRVSRVHVPYVCNAMALL